MSDTATSRCLRCFSTMWLAVCFESFRHISPHSVTITVAPRKPRRAITHGVLSCFVRKYFYLREASCQSNSSRSTESRLGSGVRSCMVVPLSGACVRSPRFKSTSWVLDNLLFVVATSSLILDNQLEFLSRLQIKCDFSIIIIISPSMHPTEVLKII